MKVSDMIHPGDKVDIRLLQQVERVSKIDGAIKIYQSQVLDLKENGNIEISMPYDGGKMVLLSLGLRYEMSFYVKGNIYRATAIVKERYKKENRYMLEMELKSNLEKFQRREFFRCPCVMDFQFGILSEEQAATYATDGIVPGACDSAFYDQQITGTMLDLSGGGIRFQSERELEPGTHILVTLNLQQQTGEKEYDIVANVLDSRRKASAAGVTYETRVKFLMTNDKIREEIIRYIFEEERRARKQR